MTQIKYDYKATVVGLRNGRMGRAVIVDLGAKQGLRIMPCGLFPEANEGDQLQFAAKDHATQNRMYDVREKPVKVRVRVKDTTLLLKASKTMPVITETKPSKAEIEAFKGKLEAVQNGQPVPEPDEAALVEALQQKLTLAISQMLDAALTKRGI